MSDIIKSVNISSSLLKNVLEIAQQASEAILNISQLKSYQIQSKKDQSPVTEADFQSHHIIHSGLTTIDSSIPILSEEGEEIPFEVRKDWKSFWLVDPLDGTREFIRGSPEYSINIALIQDNYPILGVVAAPKLNHFYWSEKNTKASKAYFQDENGFTSTIHAESSVKFPIRVAVSRSHKQSGEYKNKTITLLSKLDKYELIYYGCALKICLVARGLVDLYPRLGKTGEWDTAAGQVILESAGGKLVDLKGEPLKYNQGMTLENPPFLAINCADLLTYIVDN